MIKVILGALLSMSMLASASAFAEDVASGAVVETLGPANVAVVEIGVPPAKKVSSESAND